MTSDDASRAQYTLERLLEIPGADLRLALSRAADLIAEALRADKVDAFLYDDARDSLVALGTSDQPLSALQRKHGLDVLPLANGGRTVEVFTRGDVFVTGNLDKDPEELRGIKEALKVRSNLGVPLEVGGKRRGVIMIASQQPDFFSKDDVRFATSVTRWVGVVAHRAELVEEIARNAAEQGRRAVAEELVTVLAHDLRNYISPIELRLNLARRRAERDRREQDVRDLTIAQKGVGRLRSMIADMLDVARIEQGVFQVQLQPVDLLSILEDVATGLSTPEQPVQVRAVEEIVLAADPARIRQCLENLISNGIKYSPSNVPVTVFVRRQAGADGPRVTVEVQDEGPGVPSHLVDRLFERFVTGSSEDGGLGLGLHLSKQIALLHGGDLQIDQAAGRGARFILTLPIRHG